MYYINDLKKQVASIILSIAAVSWIIISLTSVLSIMTFLATAFISLFIFIVYNYIRRKDRIKVLLFMVFSILFFIISNLLSTLIPQIPPMFFVSVYGFASVFYYFTVIRYRIATIFITSFIPFLIYSARSDKTITLPFAMFIIFFFVMYCRRDREKKVVAYQQEEVGKLWFYLPMLFIVVFTFFVSWIFPKPNIIPGVTYLNTVVNEDFQGGGGGEQNDISDIVSGIFNPVNLKKESIVSSISAPLSKRVIFKAKADEPLYFKTRSWDMYENNAWKMGNVQLERFEAIENIYRNQVKYDRLVSLIEKAHGADIKLPLSPMYDDLWSYPSIPGVEKVVIIENTNQIFTSTIPVPNGIISAEFPINDGRKEFLNGYGMCKIQRGPHMYSWREYHIGYVSRKMVWNSREYALIKLLNKQSAQVLLDPSLYRESKRGDGGSIIGYDDFILLNVSAAELNHVYDNYLQLPENTSNRVYALAEDITKNKESDYEKAKAIERYFHVSGFVYTLDPRKTPRGEEAVEHFIFETKEGFCVHYASAMAILARACGLPSRYSEGYVADEIDEESGMYIIREKDAHAYPEIYIAGYGWMIFEPTVATLKESQWDIMMKNIYSAVGYTVKYVDYITERTPFWIRLIFLPFTVFTIIFLIWLLRRLYIKAWKRRMMAVDTSLAMDKIFYRIERHLSSVGFKRNKGETLLQYDKRIFSETGLELSKLLQVVSKAKYAGIKPLGKNIKDAIVSYQDIVFHVRGGFSKSNFIRRIWLV